MRKFATILTPAIAVLGMAALTPVPAMAAAHDRDAPRYSKQVDNRGSLRSDIAQLDNRIDRAERNRSISRKEANALRRDTDDLQRLYRNYARNGLNRQEVATLSKKVDRIQWSLRAEQRDRDKRRG